MPARLAAFISFVFLGQQVSALKHIDVKLLTFNNFGHRAWSGHWCDVGDDNDEYYHHHFCEPIFTLCLDQIDIPSASTMDALQCIKAITSRKSNGNFSIGDTEAGEIILWDKEEVNGMPNPLSATTHQKGNIALKVLVEDYDELAIQGGNDVMDKMYTHLTQTPTTNGTVNDWVNLTLVGGRTKAEPSHLSLQYRVYCAVDYYGQDCDIFCRPEHSGQGHYTCDIEGMKICRSGWTSAEANCLQPSGRLSWSETVLIVASCLLLSCFMTAVVLSRKLEETRQAAKPSGSPNKRSSVSNLGLDNIWTFPPPYTMHSTTHHNTTLDNHQTDEM